jgi:Tfp pilus assembly protein PilN
MASSKNSSNMTNRLILVVAGMLVLSALAYFSIKYFSEKSENQKKSNQISQLNTEILDLEEQIFELNNDLEEKDMDLAAKEKKIEDNKIQIKDLLARLNEAKERDKTQTDLIRGYENRLKELEGLLENYQNQITFLKDQNLLLTGQVDSLQVTQIRLQEEYLSLKANNDENLEELEQTVEKASVLRAADYQYFSVNKKGKIKEETDFRRRTLKDMRICFTIFENLVAKSGLRDVYLVLENPDGSPNTNFGDGYSGTFRTNGQEISYSAKALLDYNRRSQQVCIDYSPEIDQKFEKGTHKFRIYTDGRLIGQSDFEVK